MMAFHACSSGRDHSVSICMARSGTPPAAHGRRWSWSLRVRSIHYRACGRRRPHPTGAPGERARCARRVGALHAGADRKRTYPRDGRKARCSHVRARYRPASGRIRRPPKLHTHAVIFNVTERDRRAILESALARGMGLPATEARWRMGSMSDLEDSSNQTGASCVVAFP